MHLDLLSLEFKLQSTVHGMMERCRIKGKRGIKANKLKVMPRKLCLAPHLSWEFYWLQCWSLISSWEVKTKMRNGAGSWPLEYNYPHPKMVSLLAGITFSFIPGDSQPQLGVRMGMGSLCLPGKLRVSLFQWLL